jgi:hypothetical protein
MSRQTQTLGQPSADTVCDSLIDQTIDFIRDSLLPWKNDSNRLPIEAEEELNGQLHDFLSSRAAEKFPMVFFRHEQRQTGLRRIDLAAKPIKPVVIHGIRFTPYQSVVVIEGKRLPAPEKAREREYVTGENGKISGGIQRFKLGEHGAEHDTAIIVGYVQKNSPQDWHPAINGWISELARSHPEKWSANEKLAPLQSDDFGALAKSVSNHPRVNGCKTPRIRIHHFWIQMQ